MNNSVDKESADSINVEVENALLKSKVDELEKHIFYEKLAQEKEKNDDINLLSMIREIWDRKILLGAICFCFAVASIVLSLRIPNQYISEVLIAPTTTEATKGGLAGLASRFSGLASMAGIQLGSQNDNTSLAINLLQSKKFILDFVKKHDLTVPLMATKRWNAETNELEVNEKIYDVNTATWVRDVSFPFTPEPNDYEIFEAFSDRITVTEDNNSGFYNLSLEFYSPEIAQQWLTWLLNDLNLVIRQRDIDEADRSIEYLNNAINETNITELHTIFYELIQEQTKTKLLASIKDEYVFEIVDPPYVPFQKSKPRRAFMVIVSTFLGGILGLLVIFIPWRGLKEAILSQKR